MVSWLVLGVLGVRGDAERRAPPYWTLVGRTEQGVAMLLRVDEHGRLRTFRTGVAGRCNDGSVRNIGWRPSESGAPARFSSRGPSLEAEEVSERHRPDGSSSYITLRLNGSISRDRGHGTLRYTARYGLAAGGSLRCESPVVRWTA
jgi:hypothetical protein